MNSPSEKFFGINFTRVGRVEPLIEKNESKSRDSTSDRMQSLKTRARTTSSGDTLEDKIEFTTKTSTLGYSSNIFKPEKKRSSFATQNGPYITNPKAIENSDFKEVIPMRRESPRRLVTKNMHIRAYGSSKGTLVPQPPPPQHSSLLFTIQGTHINGGQEKKPLMGLADLPSDVPSRLNLLPMPNKGDIFLIAEVRSEASTPTNKSPKKGKRKFKFTSKARGVGNLSSEPGSQKTSPTKSSRKNNMEILNILSGEEKNLAADALLNPKTSRNLNFTQRLEFHATLNRRDLPLLILVFEVRFTYNK